MWHNVLLLQQIARIYYMHYDRDMITHDTAFGEPVDWEGNTYDIGFQLVCEGEFEKKNTTVVLKFKKSITTCNSIFENKNFW